MWCSLIAQLRARKDTAPDEPAAARHGGLSTSHHRRRRAAVRGLRLRGDHVLPCRRGDGEAEVGDRVPPVPVEEGPGDGGHRTAAAALACTLRRTPRAARHRAADGVPPDHRDGRPPGLGRGRRGPAPARTRQGRRAGAARLRLVRDDAGRARQRRGRGGGRRRGRGPAVRPAAPQHDAGHGGRFDAADRRRARGAAQGAVGTALHVVRHRRCIRGHRGSAAVLPGS